MSVKQPAELASYVKGKKNVLLMTGALCDEVDLDGKKLLDYAAEIAQKLNLPVAATGNTVVGLKDKGVKSTKHIVATEVINYMRWPWQEPLMPQKPELLVLIGYGPAAASGLVSTVKDAETVVLGNVYVDKATYSLPDASLRQYQQSLEQLIKAL